MIFFVFCYNVIIGDSMENEKQEFDKKTIEEIKRKAVYTDEGTEALADYTYDELYKKEYDDYMDYGD